ncbi:hypothetical protein SAMN04487833_12823 [Sarcina sp. DSM 11001]|nr:hypothetical protein SAMN04487833_12823 [Sarcina sp. DSM 11001]
MLRSKPGDWKIGRQRTVLFNPGSRKIRRQRTVRFKPGGRKIGRQRTVHFKPGGRKIRRQRTVRFLVALMRKRWHKNRLRVNPHGSMHFNSLKINRKTTCALEKRMLCSTKPLRESE